jgi:hypothetical protein
MVDENETTVLLGGHLATEAILVDEELELGPVIGRRRALTRLNGHEGDGVALPYPEQRLGSPLVPIVTAIVTLCVYKAMARFAGLEWRRSSCQSNLHVNVILVRRPELLGRWRLIDIIRVDDKTTDVANLCWGPFVPGANAVALTFKEAKLQDGSEEIVGKLIGSRIQAHGDSQSHSLVPPVTLYLAVETRT